MPKTIAVVGYGAVGRALVDRLIRRTDCTVRVMQRNRPGDLPYGVSFLAGDITTAADVVRLATGADHLVCALGLPYRASVWERVWPPAMSALITAATQTGARLVLADNLYMYGPVDGPLTETLPLTTMRGKPGVRAAITRQWQAAHDAGLIKAVALRSSDFYGPGVATSVLTAYGIERLAVGKSAVIPYGADFPHDLTYVPDLARALETLIEASDDAYGRAWHVPNARPARTPREVLVMAAQMMGVPARITVLSPLMRRLGGIFNGDLRALIEMSFQTDRPYLVDDSAFAQRFWGDATPLEVGLQATIKSACHR